MHRSTALTLAFCACLIGGSLWPGPGMGALASERSTPASASAAPRSTTAAGHVRYAIRPEGAWPDPSLTALRSRVVILLPWQQELMHRLKASNPRLIVLEYKDLGNASSYQPVNGVSADGVSYQEALTQHPEWLLRDRAGQPIRCTGFPYLWAMDIGNRGFQRAWATEVVHELKTQGWDGVFMDNVNPTIRYYHDPTDVAKYPSDASYSAAVTSALAYIAPKIHAAGKLAMANIGSWPNYRATATRWLRYLDGAMDERFAKFTPARGQGYRSPGEWRTELSILQQVQREGKWFMGITQSSDGDTQAERFGWATMLLGSAGHAIFALQNDANYGVETWFSDYEAPIGHPLGPASQQPSGVHRRRFSRGLVLVNPTARRLTVRLGGRYTGDGLHSARTATMAPHTGLILVRVNIF
jgi:endo-alpha-1,4-polygalactosaminidase (GH114 family)